MLRFLTLLLIAAALACAAGTPAYYVYVGTYTGHGSQGIYVYRFDPITGALADFGLAAQTDNPSFLTADPSGTHLYAVKEDNGGTVTAYRINRATGKLVELSRVSSGGDSPCALAVDHTGKYLLAANYRSGSVAFFPLRADGNFAAPAKVDAHHGSSLNRQRQEKPHAHSAVFSPDNRYALSADLGTDLIYIYRFDAKRGTLQLGGTAGVMPGSGPRHLAFSDDGKFVYVLNELTATITTFAWNDGVMRDLGSVSALPPDYKGPKSGAEILVHPNGRFLYASTRGDSNDIAIFRMDAASGRLAPAGHVPSGGRTPRNFGIDPTGKYLFAANQDSNNIVIFRIDPVSGMLTPSGKTIAVSSPVYVQFVAIN